MYQFMIKHKACTVIISVLLLTVSLLFIAPYMSNPENYLATEKMLKERENTVFKLTAASAISSAAIAMVPGDSTSAIADAITDLTLFFVISLAALYLQEFLLTLNGLLIFRAMAAISFVLVICVIKSNKIKYYEWLKKIILFSLIVLLIVPCSTYLSEQILDIKESTINSTIDNADSLDTSEEDGFIERLSNGVSDKIDAVKAKLSGFVASVAIMLLVSCVIPILVLIALIFAAKTIFDIKYDFDPVDLFRKMKHSRHSDKKHHNSENIAESAEGDFDHGDKLQ